MIMSTHRIHLHHLILFAAFLLSVMAPKGATAKSTEVSFKTCLNCHPDVKKELAQKGAHDPFKKLECSSCHNPHATKHEKLLKEEVGKLCKSCHRGQEGLMAKKYQHEPYEAGECLACHRPHASSNPGLLAAKGDELCFSCHAKAGSFSKKNQHDPVKKGRCLSCHTAHTSDHEDLVKKDRKQLCVSCHAIKDSTTQKAHLGYPVEGTDCMSCHSPHGSDRNCLVKDSLHRPFAQQKCVTCHNGLGSKHPLGLKDEGTATCLSCHPSTAEDFQKINSHVGAGVFCVSCHSPHASDQSHLKKAKEAKICFSCHEDTQEDVKDKKNDHKHPLVKEGKCSPCHRPHGSNFRLFFGDEELLVCTACHQRHAKFTHPIGADAIDPRSKGEITCITCHNLMGSPYNFSLRADRKKQLCIQCHKGY
jgi:predicted CXXCH cytochrome family protein